jgi:transcriptional regulator with XRE-family HTH domain
MDERATYAAVVGQVIQHLRSGRMTQQQLAEKASLSQSSLSRFEKGQSLPDLFETRRLARALGKKPGEFVDLLDQALARTADVAKKVSPSEPLDGLAAVALGSLAVLGVVALLGEAEKKNRKKGSR